MNRCYLGDCRDVLRDLARAGVHVQMCVTSPPYFRLRDYGVAGQLGMEATPQEYVERMVDVFRLVRDVLADDAVLWLNLGDSYAGAGHGGNPQNSPHQKQATNADSLVARIPVPTGLKPKDLIGIPWRVAFALQADGWYLRQDIIWAKPNPMPESVTDRCTKSHEYLFLLSVRDRYYYDAHAISQPAAQSSIDRLSQPTLGQQQGSARVPGKTNGTMKAVFGGRAKHAGFGTRIHSGNEDEGRYIENGVNKRSVWTVATQPYSEAHFATFPPALIEPCILAGSRPGDIVLDPFFGSGTTGEVAARLGRQWIGIELNPEYVELAKQRTAQQGMVL